MDRNRLWILGAALVVGVTIVLGWLLGISPQLADLRAARTERISVEEQNTIYELQLETLQGDFEELDGVQRELAELRTSVPTGAQLPDFVAEVDALARQNGLSLSALTVSDAEAYDRLAAATDDTAATDAAATDTTADPATDATADSAATAEESAIIADAAPAVPPAVPPVTNDLITAANFVSVPVQITLVGGYDQVLDFLDGLRQGERLVSVSAVSTTAVEAGTADAPATAGVTASISALIFVLRDVDAE